MKTKKDHPGVYPPPPLFYVLIFLFSVFIQLKVPLPTQLFSSEIARLSGFLFISLGFLFIVPALIKFFKTKNTLVTILPARSLQTSGIYSISRNPMYVGLLSLYMGIAFFKGNYWTFIFIPLVIFIVSKFVIVNEEKYLSRTFGEDFEEYKKKVRRWI
jgi:protein-S-isoprenylcysteine O-methyltransferase Ste14